MKLPLVQDLLKHLVSKPITNPFPARRMPGSVTDTLSAVAAGKAQLAPPVPMPATGRGAVAYDASKCVGCKMCIQVCPAHAIEFVPETKKVRVFLGGCIACAQCADVCAKKALVPSPEFLKAAEDRAAGALVLG
mgnify:CR=1 FL=1